MLRGPKEGRFSQTQISRLIAVCSLDLGPRATVHPVFLWVGGWVGGGGGLIAECSLDLGPRATVHPGFFWVGGWVGGGEGRPKGHVSYTILKVCSCRCAMRKLAYTIFF